MYTLGFPFPRTHTQSNQTHLSHLEYQEVQWGSSVSHITRDILSHTHHPPAESGTKPKATEAADSDKCTLLCNYKMDPCSFFILLKWRAKKSSISSHYFLKRRRAIILISSWTTATSETWAYNFCPNGYNGISHMPNTIEQGR